MNSFIKVTAEKPALSGYQKTAILLGELGPENSKPVLEALNLSPSTMRKITKAMKKLGKYSPSDRIQVSNEMEVMASVTKYGLAKGILSKRTSRQDAFVEQTRKEMRDIAHENPENLATVLRTFLGED